MDKYRDSTSSENSEARPVTSKTLGKTLGALALAGLSVVYIINPTAGFIEFIPDNLPFIGNLDEATAMIVLLGCLRYLGFDALKWLNFARDLTGKAGDISAPNPKTGRREKVVSPVDPEVEAARSAMYGAKR